MEQSSRSPQPSEHNAGKPVNGARIALLGVSYKQGVGDIRESPALKIIKLLAKQGAESATTTPTSPHSPDLSLRSLTLRIATVILS